MGGCKLWSALLLLLSVCAASEVTLVKTIGKQPDVTPVCPNNTLDTILLIVCKVTTERYRGEECRLLYRDGQGFEHNCDSRITLIKENQTVFLHLTSLTPVDSGNYTCECAYDGGTDFLHLSVTVEEDEDDEDDEGDRTPITMPIAVTVIFATAFIILTACGLILSKNNKRKRHKPSSSLPNTEPLDIEPYSTFIHRENGLYSTVKMNLSNT